MLHLNILRKLKAEEVYKDSVFLSKGFPNYYMHKKGNTRFIEMIDNQVVSFLRLHIKNFR